MSQASQMSQTSQISNLRRALIRPRTIGATLALAALAGCDLYGVDSRVKLPPAAPAEDSPIETGQALLEVASVPDDVKCLRITAKGTTRTEERELEVAKPEDLTQPLAGLPLGTVVFTGEAFAAACTSVTKSTVADWASDDVTVSLVAGRVASVKLAMTRNGRANVGVTFTEESACSAIGATCRIASECCSKHCVLHACAQSTADGGVTAGTAPATGGEP